jgi:hypothetical protein
MINKLDIAGFIINEIERNNLEKFDEEELFIKLNKNLCNDVLYSDLKYKESTIIVSHILKNLMIDFLKEVNNCVKKEGAYKNE